MSETSSNPAQLERLQTRVMELEILCTHLERLIGDLNGVVLDQQKQLEVLRLKLTETSAQLTELSAPPGEAPKPEDEKPPHY
jgi:uncharacterized coiled-coil protein SlyX